MDSEFDVEKLKRIYVKVVEVPNKDLCRRGFIKCPECGEEILMVPRLRMMSDAIEAHVQMHKEMLRGKPVKVHHKAILIRLALVEQVLQLACRAEVS